MSDDERIIIVCLRQDQGDPHVPSVAGRCAECRAPIWISDNTERQIRGIPSARLTCSWCAAAAIVKIDPEEITFGVLPGTMEEVQTYLEREG